MQKSLQVSGTCPRAALKTGGVVAKSTRKRENKMHWDFPLPVFGFSTASTVCPDKVRMVLAEEKRHSETGAGENRVQGRAAKAA